MASTAASHVAQVEAPSVSLAPLLAKTTPIIFVVPAFDEEQNLPRLLADLEARPDLEMTQMAWASGIVIAVVL